MANENKPVAPPSELKQSEEAQVAEVGYHAIMIKVKDDFSSYDIIEDFEHEGTRYHKSAGLTRAIIEMVHSEQKMTDTIRACIPEVIEGVLGREITVDIPKRGRTKLLTLDYIANVVGDILIRKQESQKNKIIRPT